MQYIRSMWIVVCLGVIAFWGVSQGFADTTTPTWSPQNFALGGGHVMFSSPTIADIDGDGKDEVLIGTTRKRCDYNGSNCTFSQQPKLVVINSNGTIKWSRLLESSINSAPSVADIDGDGDVEIVVSFGGEALDPQGNGGVRAFDHNGNVLWTFYTYDYYDPHPQTDGVFSTPALCDVDNDGDLEIAFGAWDQRIYLLDHRGQSLWNDLHWDWADSGRGYINADTVWSSPACADFNGDGEQEIVIGADISDGGIMPDGTPGFQGGFVYVFDRFGNVLARRDMPEAIYSSPAIADLDNDGKLEIVIGTGLFWWNMHGRTETRYVYVFRSNNLFNSSLHYSDPAKLPYAPGWPQPTAYPGMSSPAIADLDGDGDLEIIIGSGDPFVSGSDGVPGKGAVYAWHHTGELVSGWPIYPISSETNGSNDAAIRSSPTVADIDNDGQVEVLFAFLWEVQAYSPNGQLEYLFNAKYSVEGSPAVADTDKDGFVEVWIGGSLYDDQSQGYLWRFESNVSGVGAMPWPMFHRDAAHIGSLGRPAELVLPTENLFLMIEEGQTRAETSFYLRNSGDYPLDWAIASKPTNVSVSLSSGTLPPHGQQVLSLTVDVSGYAPGTYTLGEILFSASYASTARQVALPLSTYIGKVYKSFVSVVSR